MRHNGIVFVIFELLPNHSIHIRRRGSLVARKLMENPAKFHVMIYRVYIVNVNMTLRLFLFNWNPRWKSIFFGYRITWIKTAVFQPKEIMVWMSMWNSYKFYCSLLILFVEIFSSVFVNIMRLQLFPFEKLIFGSWLRLVLHLFVHWIETIYNFNMISFIHCYLPLNTENYRHE